MKSLIVAGLLSLSFGPSHASTCNDLLGTFRNATGAINQAIPVYRARLYVYGQRQDDYVLFNTETVSIDLKTSFVSLPSGDKGWLIGKVWFVDAKEMASGCAAKNIRSLRIYLNKESGGKVVVSFARFGISLALTKRWEEMGSGDQAQLAAILNKIGIETPTDGKYFGTVYEDIEDLIAVITYLDSNPRAQQYIKIASVSQDYQEADSEWIMEEGTP